MATGGGVGVTVDGMDELLRKVGDRNLVAGPSRAFLTSCAVQTQGYARQNAPHDGGRLDNSIAYNIDSAQFPTFAKVGSNAPPAKPMEYGTGLLSDAPDSKRTRHFPPPLALSRWSERRGLNPFAVARGIWKRGGLSPRRYLRKAFQQVRSDLPRFLSRFARDIESLWVKR